MLSPIF